FSSRRRHTRFKCDWSSDVCSSDLLAQLHEVLQAAFGWTDSHLHQFNIGGLIYGAPEFNEDGLSDSRIFEATEVRMIDLHFPYDPDESPRSEEHTSELQSHLNLVCRLLLEKKT